MKFFFCIAALAVAISSCEAALNIGFPSSTATECSKFTVDKCVEAEIYETISDIPDVETWYFLSFLKGVSHERKLALKKLPVEPFITKNV